MKLKKKRKKKMNASVASFIIEKKPLKLHSSAEIGAFIHSFIHWMTLLLES